MPSNTTIGIIDVYEQNAYTLAQLSTAGVTAVIHKATEGDFKTDSKYTARKAAAVGGGILWGAYHLTNGSSPKKQIDRFLSVEDGADGKTLMALDWEKSHDGTIVDLDGLREMITLFHAKLGFYPVLYGGHMLRDTPEIVMGDALLAKCPVWYQRYLWEPKALPVKTWPDYTLWQFADENRGFGAPPSSVLPGADFNRFKGSAAELAAAWPFRTKVAAAGGGITPLLPRKYEVTASSLNVRTAPGIENKVLGALTRGDVVPGLEFNSDKSWVRVDKGGKLKGWAAISLLKNYRIADCAA